jgi:hypothetical protein
MSHTEDRHECGGLWVGGVCVACQAQCLCPACTSFGIAGKVRERNDKGEITRFDLESVSIIPKKDKP